MLQGIRDFFVQRGYLEVETPYVIPTLAPETHIDAVAADGGYLHTSPELCMKRLLAAGYRKIFQISKCFRAGERGSMHLPEFTLLEWYRVQSDYYDLMGECEHLILFLARRLDFGESLRYQGKIIDLRSPWERLSVEEAFQRYSDESLKAAMEEGNFYEVMSESIEPHLGKRKPTFIYDYPACFAALSRIRRDNRALAERFELYMAGMELANAFSELTDPEEQRRRFEREQIRRRDLGKPVYPVPEKFLAALKFMPEAAGIAVGVDRLAMIFADRATVDDVVTFAPEEM